MDEMTLLRELGEEIDTTTGAPEPRTRRAVVAGIGDDGGRPPRRTTWLAPRRALPVGAALLAGGLAVAVLPGLGAEPDAPPPPAPTLDARTILLAAADTARAAEFAAPDPDAFVYTRSKERDRAGTVTTREAWRSVDGSRAGLVTPSGSTDLVQLDVPSEPAFRSDLPAGPDAMRRYLYRNASESENGGDVQAFELGRSLLAESLVRPAVRAAIFEALATIPGTEVVTGTTTVSGRAGVAVTMTSPEATRTDIVFDPRSHEMIGYRQLDVGRRAPAGGVEDWSSAVLEMAVVDRVRLRPDGTVRPG